MHLGCVSRYVRARTSTPEEWAIPKRIITTFIRREVDCVVWEAQMSLLERNPDMEYLFFDDESQELFMREQCAQQQQIVSVWKRL